VIMLTIRSRLTYQFVLLVTLILLLFSLGVYFFSEMYLEKRFFRRLQDRAITTTTLLFDLRQPDAAVLKLIDAADQENLLNEEISVYDQRSRALVFTTNPANTRFHASWLPRLDPAEPTVYLTEPTYQLVALNLVRGQTRHWVIVSGVDQYGQEALADLRKILIVMVLAAVLLISVAGWLFADRALAPMSGIVQQVNAIFPANVSQRVDHPNQSDEIGLLVKTFNQLLDRIEEAIRKQKIFIANVSHELKNPLTKINAQIDVALIQPREPEAYRQTLRSLREDTQHLAQLTHTLLELANTSLRGHDLPFEPVRMDELLWETKARLTEGNAGYRVELAFPDFPEVEDELILPGNRAALAVLLMNLLENACKFSPDHTARVTYRTGGGTMTISVANQGPPIPAQDLPYIFQPFFRGNATAQSHQGHGVGLAVAQQVTAIHGGELSVESGTEGTRFTVRFGKSRLV